MASCQDMKKFNFNSVVGHIKGHIKITGPSQLLKVGEGQVAIATADAAAVHSFPCSWALILGFTQRKPTHYSFLQIKDSDPETSTVSGLCSQPPPAPCLPIPSRSDRRNCERVFSRIQ